MGLCKGLVDAEFIYNLSGLDNCDIIHLFRSDWLNMALIQVVYPHVLLFLLFVGLIYFSMYFLSYVSPVHTFPSTVILIKKHLHKLVISYHCVALVMIFEVHVFASLQEYHYFEKQWVFYIEGIHYMRVVFNTVIF